MNAAELNEVKVIADRLDRWSVWVRWGVGSLASIAVAAVVFVVALDGRVTSLEKSDMGRDRQITEISRRVGDWQEAAAKDRASLSHMAAQIEAQGQTLRRIDGALGELNRYLRDRGAR